MSSKTVTIRDRSNPPVALYSGEFDTKRELIEWVIAQGGSLAGADLSNHDLSHMNLDGVDFTGADLSCCRLMGSKANGAIFNDAILSGVRGEGMTAKGAKFIRAVFGTRKSRGRTVGPSFDGSTLTYSHFDGAKVIDGSFENCGLTGTTWDMAEVTKTSFKNSFVHNANWTRSMLRYNSFVDAELHTSANGNAIPRSSMPDRTYGAIAIGNDYQGCIMDDTAQAFLWDRTFSKVARQVAWGASVGAMLIATSYLPIEPSGEWLGKMFGQGAMMIGAFALLNMLKEKIGDLVTDKISETTMKVSLAVRAAGLEISQRGGNFLETVATLGNGPGLAPFRRALAMTSDGAEKDGIFSVVKSIVVNDTAILLCDRRHMAKALELMCSSYGRSRLLKKDMVFSRVAHDSDGAPSVIKLFAGGGMAAFWAKGNEIETVLHWSADEMEPLTWPVAGKPGVPRRNMEAVAARQLFEEAVVHDHMPNANLTYDRMADQIRAGRDGSIVLTKQKTQLTNNPNGPILLKADGSEYDRAAAKELKLEEMRDNGPYTFR